MQDETTPAAEAAPDPADEALDKLRNLGGENEAETTGEIRPFVDTLRELERGALLDKLDRLQHDLVHAIEETHRGGTLTIKLNYKLSGRGQISVTGEIKEKLPEEPPGESVFFVSPEGNLVREHPGQGRLPFGSGPRR